MLKNHEADIKNPNKKTSGVNDAYKKARDNRSEQLNPNNPKYKGKKEMAISMSSKKLVNAPSTTGNRSGKKRGNAPLKRGVGK